MFEPDVCVIDVSKLAVRQFRIIWELWFMIKGHLFQSYFEQQYIILHKKFLALRIRASGAYLHLFRDSALILKNAIFPLHYVWQGTRYATQACTKYWRNSVSIKQQGVLVRPKKVETAVQGCKVPLLTDDNPQPDDHTRRSTDAQLTTSKKKRGWAREKRRKT